MKATTESALLLSDGTNEGWCPRSLLEDHEDADITRDADKGDEGTAFIPQWKAEELEFV